MNLILNRIDYGEACLLWKLMIILSFFDVVYIDIDYCCHDYHIEVKLRDLPSHFQGRSEEIKSDDVTWN